MSAPAVAHPRAARRLRPVPNLPTPATRSSAPASRIGPRAERSSADALSAISAPTAASPAGHSLATAADAPVTVTISIAGGAGRERVLAALRDLVNVAGATVDVSLEQTPAAASAAGPGLRLDPRARTAVRDGEGLDLSRLEFDLLLFLVRHPKQVFTRSQLLTQVWGHTHTTLRTVDVHVSRLRNKLADPDVVTTVYGLGYRLADEAPVAVAG